MAPETVVQIRISLEDVEPAVWRLVDVPVGITLALLHSVVQAAMGWDDHHLWEFEAGGRRYGIRDRSWPNGPLPAAKARLGALLGRGVRELVYTYDMGDDWRHRLTVEGIGPAEAGAVYPRFVAGARRCPPEDCGGAPGFEALLEVLADPEHEEHADLLEWLGESYDPAVIDETLLRGRVAAIDVGRRAGKAVDARRRG